MCGIIGFIGHVRRGQWGQTHSLLRALFIAAEHRGLDATGFVADTESLRHPFRNQLISDKEPLAASEFVATNRAFQALRHRRCLSVLGHVRAATHGSPQHNWNNHPFVGKRFSVVHNGVINNHADLTDKYVLRRTTQCDSEVILRLVEASKDPALGLMTCLAEVQGSMAVGLHDQRDGTIYLARNEGRPLWLARLRGDHRWFIGSTDSILARAIKGVVGSTAMARLDYLAPIPSGTVIALTPQSTMIACRLLS